MICYIANRYIDNAEEVGQHSRVIVSALLPSDVIDFAMLPAQRFLAGNSFIVRCHVTSK